MRSPFLRFRSLMITTAVAIALGAGLQIDSIRRNDAKRD